MPSEPDTLPFRHASLFGIPRDGHASGCEVEVSDQHEDLPEGKNGGHDSSTDWTNQGEFEFSFWASLYADDAALPLSSRESLLAATNAIHKHLRLFGLLMHVGAPGKKSKTEAMY